MEQPSETSCLNAESKYEVRNNIYLSCVHWQHISTELRFYLMVFPFTEEDNVHVD